MPNRFANCRLMYNVPVRMRDGVTLRCDVIRPDGDDPLPAILVRTSYYKEDVYAGTENWLVNAFKAAARGYNFVVQDTRGTGCSEGVSDPLGFEAEDGYDSVEAIARMPWCDGRVGMMGFSFLGYCCMEAARLNPPHLKAVIPGMCGYWKNPFLLRYGVPTARRAGGNDSFERAYQAVVDHLEDDAFFARIGRERAYDQTRVPVLNFTGWMDMELNTTIDNYRGYREEGASQAARETRLIVGPWLHDSALKGVYGRTSFGPEASGTASGTDERMLQWFDRHLKGLDAPYLREKPVRLFIMGKNAWIEAEQYPPPESVPTPYYLHSHGDAAQGGGTLTREPPRNEPPDRYLYDPARPFRSIDPLSLDWFDDQAERERRGDMLLYTTALFDGPTVLCGPVELALYAASTARDTDFACRLLLVAPDGEARLLAQNLVRARYREGRRPELIEPGRVYAYALTVGNVGVEAPAGYALRIEIMSSLVPAAQCNPNTEDPIGTAKDYLLAEQTICHDAAHPSRIDLPVMREGL